jgi:dolichol-phosphate mannosyltransferase
MEHADGTPAADVVIGSRYTAGGAIEGWPFKRHAMSRAVNALARLLLGLEPADCSGAFRCYRVELLRELDFDAVRSRGYSFQEEILWHLARRGAKMIETPITFADRRLGSSKINSGEAVGALRILLSLGAKNWLGRRPPARSERHKDQSTVVV